MSLLWSEEHTMLRDSARDFLAAQSPVALQRRLRDTAVPLGFDPALWAQSQALGWGAAAWPEAAGGLGVGYAGLGAVFEEMGRHLAALPLLSSCVLGAELLLRCADPLVQATWLPALQAGTRRLALALDEAGRHRPLQPQCTAVPEGSGWRLKGDKHFVIDGVGADAYLVTARGVGGSAGLSLFLVDATTPGLHVRPRLLTDSRNHAELGLDGVCVPGTARWACDPVDAGATGPLALALAHTLDRARALLAAESLGLLRAVFERTADYLKERVQFDVPIGSFQALQHRMARLYVELELLDSSVRGALFALDDARPDAARLVSLAKARAADLAERVGNEAVQLHGGIGVTDELDLGLFVKRGRVLQHLLGDAVFHRNRYAESLDF